MDKGKNNLNKLRMYNVPEDEAELRKQQNRKNRYLQQYINSAGKSGYISEKEKVVKPYDSRGLDDFFRLHAAADIKVREKSRKLTLKNNLSIKFQAFGLLFALTAMVLGSFILTAHNAANSSDVFEHLWTEASAALTPIPKVVFYDPADYSDTCAERDLLLETIFYETLETLSQSTRAMGEQVGVRVSEERIRELVQRFGMTYIDQHAIGMPNGCELASLAMVISRDYRDITADDILERFLDRRIPVYYNGVLYGDDPSYYYIGDPRLSPGGFGIFAPGLTTAAHRILHAFDIPKTAHNISGASEEELFWHISQGNPVIIWYTINLAPVNWDYVWRLPDNTPYSYPLNQHCAVLVGYTDTTVTMYDPIFGIVEHDRELFLQRWSEVGPWRDRTRQAIVIK